MNIIMRNATVEDASNIAKVHCQSWQESYSGLIEQSYLEKDRYAARLQWHHKRICDVNHHYLVALVDDCIVGFCTAAPFTLHNNQCINEEQKARGLDFTDKGEIDGLYVLRAYQGMGIGKKLFSRAWCWLQEQHLCPFIVWTFKNNFKARSFYESQGGVLTKEIDVEVGGDMYREVAYQFAQV